MVIFKSIVAELTANPLLTMFVVIGLGYLLGELSFFGFRVGVAGVLFMGLAVGALGPGISVPELVPTLGLILFIYSIGLHSGPGFFQSLRKQGWRDSALAFGVLCFGMLLTLAISWPLHVGGPRRAGLFAGALTNTPALAAVREQLHERGTALGWTAEQLRAISDEPTVAYSITYPFGVIGVLLCFQLTRWWWKPVYKRHTPGAEIHVRDFVVKNPAIVGRTVAEVLRPHDDPGFVISRVRHDRRTDVPHSELRLNQGDIVAVVGEDEAMERAEQIFGESTDMAIEHDRSELDLRRVIVSSKEVVGKRLRELRLEDSLAATVTRVRRGDVDIVPSPDTRVEYGDQVRVLTRRENFPRVSRFFGDSVKGTAELDFGSVAIGLVLGVLVGMIPVPLPGGGVLRLGMAGGPLLVALVLGNLERTGRITWTMPVSANLTLRQIGLLFFLAGVGVRAGYSFLQTLRGNGWTMLAAGAIVTFAVTLVTLVVGYKVLRIPFDALTGLVSGVQTQPACLAYAGNMTNSEVPNVVYAGVYPVAMIAKIILAQLLA